MQDFLQTVIFVPCTDHNRNSANPGSDRIILKQGKPYKKHPVKGLLNKKCNYENDKQAKNKTTWCN
jgi:hypothetical protein